MSHTALFPATEPDLEELIRSVALDAVRRIQDALRFCPHSHVRGLLRALREARDLTRNDESSESAPAAVPRPDDAHRFIYRDEDGRPFVFEATAHGASTVEARWLSDEESAAVAARVDVENARPKSRSDPNEPGRGASTSGPGDP